MKNIGSGVEEVRSHRVLAHTVQQIRLLGRHKSISATFQQRCDSSTQIDREDENERVRLRFETLVATTAAGPGTVCIDRVLRTIEDLKFMITWANNCRGDCGKVWVKTQYDVAFQNSHEYCARFEHLDAQQKKKAEMAEPEVVDLLAQWKRKNEKMITKRWQLWNGY
ncbi:hypothetical protein PLICRDRAFT_244258 [Plicaturopsis crispa FD-325 SS-3]|nr:hypothetical protein PLICRDRAFT_244258 [Plicaturopsis crispa FD-325 SS-3]